MYNYQICVGHEIKSVAVSSRSRGNKIKFEFGLLLQGQPLDGQQGVGLGVPDYNPPAFFAFGGEEGCYDGTRDFILSLEVDLDEDGLAALQVVLVHHGVLQLNVWVPVAEAGYVGHLKVTIKLNATL